MQVVEDLRGAFGKAAPPGPWPDPPRQAVVVPIRSNISRQLAGIRNFSLVAGVSTRLELDDSYRSFYELVANQIAAALANARAHEVEHKRAEALAEIDRAKTTFFSNVSHEFRTPLTLILGHLEDTHCTCRNRRVSTVVAVCWGRADLVGPEPRSAIRQNVISRQINIDGIGTRRRMRGQAFQLKSDWGGVLPLPKNRAHSAQAF